MIFYIRDVFFRFRYAVYCVKSVVFNAKTLRRKDAKNWFSISLRRLGDSLLTTENTENTEDVMVKPPAAGRLGCVSKLNQ